jgi:pimeloyl-ACP methyl ester carboxylesterase
MRTCSLNDLEVAYEEIGAGRPILFLHGWSLDHTLEMFTFEPIFARRPGWRRLYLDMPGHGRTPGPEWIDCMDTILQVILDFIDIVAPGERLALVGTSAGALPARGIVYRRPEQVSGVLLRIPLIVADDAERTLPEPVVFLKDEAFMAQLPPEEREQFGDMIIQNRDYYELNRQVVQRYVEPAQARMDEACLTRIREDPSRYGLSFDVDDLPEPFEGPSLIMAGRQDMATGYRDAWRLLDQYPRATYVAFDRAEHGFFLDKEELVQALIHDWLDRLEEAEGQLQG